MNWRAKAVALCLALAGLAAPPAALAGRHCEARELTPAATADAFDAALSLKGWLDQQTPSVALVARRGQNLTEYKLTYSHVGFVLRGNDGTWSVLHDLNTCGSDRSNLFEQGLAEFFADDLYSTEVALVVPTPAVQQALLRVLAPDQRFRMHEAHYSAVAYPFALKYQNSNGWLLETFANALSVPPLADRSAAQALLQQLQYEPSVLNVDPLKRLGGRMFKANIAFDDHPGNLRWSNRITVNTGDALMRFASRWGQEQPGCEHGSFGPRVCVLPSVTPAKP